MHKYIDNHRIHTLVALEQENLYYTHDTRDSANTSCSNIITIFRSAPMKNSNPDVLSTVRILYPPRMAGHSGFVHRAVCMGENLLRNAIDRDMSPIEATGFFKRRYEVGNNSYAKYFKDNYDGIHMNIGAGLFPYGLGDGTVTIKLYFGMDYLSKRQYERASYELKRSLRMHMMQLRTRPPYSGAYCDTDEVSAYCEAACYMYNRNNEDSIRHVSLLDTAPPNLKKLCDSLIDGSVKGDLTGVPVVSITRAALKEYNELEAKYQSACGQVSEYEEENRKLKEKLEEINKLVKTAMPDWNSDECLRFMGSGRYSWGEE